MVASRLFFVALGGVVLSVLTASCQDPTQLTLAITTNAKCHDELTSTAIYVGGSLDAVDKNVQKGSSATQTAACDSGNIGTLVVTPGNSEGAVVIIGAFYGQKPEQCVADNFANCIVARRSFTFIKHTPLTIPIELERDCLNVPCDVHSTCHNGQCYAATVSCNDNGTCTKPGDGDAGPVDAGPNAYVDAESLSDAPSSSSDGSTESDSGTTDSGATDTGVDAGLTASNDAGIVTSEAGVPIVCLADAGSLEVTNCGNSPACLPTQGCCVFAGSLQCVSLSMCTGKTTYCCTDSECPSGTCQGGGAVVNVAAPPHIAASVKLGGSVGQCM